MKWCEIFRTGKFADSKGNVHNWTISDLEKIRTNFETKNPDVPICCGHPKSNSPAYGWVESMKVSGDKLYASFKDVQPEFKEAVAKGLFKTRSISLISDLVPRHIAFLGAQAPAIKGMEQFCFSGNDESEIIIDFNEANDDDNMSNSAYAEPNGEEGASSPLETGGKLGLENSSPTTPPNVKGEKMTEELEKQLTQKDEEIAELKKRLEDSRQESLKKEFEDFCDNAIQDGHILPFQKNDVINILTACSDSAMNFADSEGKEQNTGELFKTFITGLKQMDFSDVADKNKVDEEKEINFNDAEDVAINIRTLQKEYAEKGIELSPASALAKLRGK